MQLNQIFGLDEYESAYEYVMKNNYMIEEIEPNSFNERQFRIAECPRLPEIVKLRHMRERECFSLLSKSAFWYEALTEEQRNELRVWYKAWLDVTETKVIPEKPSWLK